jgi:orotidine-5'-phosphate decarboxylase
MSSIKLVIENPPRPDRKIEMLVAVKLDANDNRTAAQILEQFNDFVDYFKAGTKARLLTSAERKGIQSARQRR